MSIRDVSTAPSPNNQRSASPGGTRHNMPLAITSTASPFLLRTEDVESLAHSDGFSILREHLTAHYTYDLCHSHTPANLEDKSRWLLVRDVLHALLVPVVELHDKAVSLAALVTHATKSADLEYAFTKQARSAFLWLQCFLSREKEREWCYTRGCPACVIDHSLDSEFTIRLLYTACLLSDVHYPFTIDGPTLPSFMFFLDSLERALAKDSFYGPEFFEATQPKAVATRNGIEELIHQCLELDTMLSRATSPSTTPSRLSSAPDSPGLTPSGATPSSGLKVKRSKITQRQPELQVEEEQWDDEMLKCCWDQISPAEQEQVREASQSLDAVLKEGPTVAVVELRSSG